MTIESVYLQDWQELDKDTKQLILSNSDVQNFLDETNLLQTRLYSKPLIFYPGYDLYKLQVAYNRGTFEHFFIFNREKGELKLLNWTSPPIHELNQESPSPLMLNGSTAADYLRFFCDFVCGEEGPFTIVEHPSHPRFSKDILSQLQEVKTKEITEALIPVDIKEEAGNYSTKAVVWYKNYLFEAHFIIPSNGVIEMKDENPICELPGNGLTPWHKSKYSPSSTVSSKPKGNSIEINNITKETVEQYVKQNLHKLKPGLIVKTIPYIAREPNTQDPTASYVLDNVSNYIWMPWLLKEEKKKLEEQLDELKEDKPEITEDGDYLKLDVLAIRANLLRKLSLKVRCREPESEGTDPQDKKRDNIKKGDIVLDKEKTLIDTLPEKIAPFDITTLPVTGYQWQDEDNQVLKERVLYELACCNPGFNYGLNIINFQGSIRKAGLPFYNNGEINDTILFEIAIPKENYTSQEPPNGSNKTGKLDLVFYLIYREGCFETVGIDWTSPPIHRINTELKWINLTEDNVKDYLRFFCDFVCGEKGPFTVIESPDHPRFLNTDPNTYEYEKSISTDKQSIGSLVGTLKIIKAKNDQKEGFSPATATLATATVEGCVWYHDTLFSATFEINKDGGAEMVGDNPIVTLKTHGNTIWNRADIISNYLTSKNLLKIKDNEKQYVNIHKLYEKTFFDYFPGTDIQDKTFIEEINSPSFLIPSSLRISNCRFRRKVDFSALQCKGQLKIENCVFENGLNLSNSQLAGGLTLTNVTVFGKIQTGDCFSMPGLNAARIDIQNLYCTGSADFKGLKVKSEVTVVNLYAQGNVSFAQSNIEASVNFHSFKNNGRFFVGGHLDMKDFSCRHLKLSGLDIKGILDLSNSKINGGFTLTRNDDFEFKAAAYLDISHIQAEYLYISGIIVAGEFTARNSVIQKHIFIGSYTSDNKDISAYHTSIGFWDDFHTGKTDYKLSLSLYGITIKDGYLALSGVKIAKDLDLRLAKIGTGLFIRPGGKATVPNQIGGSLLLKYLIAPAGIYLEGIKIEKKLEGPFLTTDGKVIIYPALMNKNAPNTNHSQTAKEELLIDMPEIKEGIDLSQGRIRGINIAGLNISKKADSGYSIDLKQAKIAGNLSFYPEPNELTKALKETYLANFENDHEIYKHELQKIDKLVIKPETCITSANFGINLKSCTIDHDLPLSYIQCANGNINLESANIGGDLKITQEAISGQGTNLPPARAINCIADSAQIGDDMDVSGLELEHDFSAQKITVGGKLLFYNNEKKQAAKIRGHLNLESAKKIGVLAISKDYSKEKSKGAIILKQAYIERLQVWYEHNDKDAKINRNELFPRPVELDFMSVDYWEFKDKNEDPNKKDHEVDDYIGFLDNAKPFQRHTYRAVEDTLLNQGLEEDADKIHIALSEKMLEIEKEKFKKVSLDYISLLFTKNIFGRLTSFGTNGWKLLVIAFIWLIVSSVIFGDSMNINVSSSALKTNVKHCDNHPCADNWNWADGLAIALRYHIPIISLDAHNEWEPSDDPDSYLLSSKFLTPESYATTVAILHWIILPFIVFAFSRRFLRKRGSS